MQKNIHKFPKTQRTVINNLIETAKLVNNPRSQEYKPTGIYLNTTPMASCRGF